MVTWSKSHKLSTHISVGTFTAKAQSGCVHAAIGDSVAILTGKWKFHPADDRKFATPDFDDSNWGLQDLTPLSGSFDPVLGRSGIVPSWTAQGYPNLKDYVWHRLRMRMENAASRSSPLPLALSITLSLDALMTPTRSL